MGTRLAIIGAGPSGLAAAKAALECGLEPVIFEAKPSIGGLWQSPHGLVWNNLRTNLSKWSCAFSDHPWPADIQDFPDAQQMRSYLESYVEGFMLKEYIRCGCRVTSLTWSGDEWMVRWTDGGQKSHRESFRFTVVASGAFNTPYVPSISGLANYKGRYIHSAKFRDGVEFRGKRVAVVGTSFSGVEIAAELANHGAEVVLLFRRPVWLLPRYINNRSSKVPLDLAFYVRSGQPDRQVLTDEQLNMGQAKYFETTFGNPGDIHQNLHVTCDAKPPFIAISDTFADHVRSGRITPIRTFDLEFAQQGIAVGGMPKSIGVHTTILCTGFSCDLSFISKPVLEALSYRSEDRFVPLLANKAVLHHDVPTIAFVGVYRGPYFAVIELQARWACQVFSGILRMPSRRKSMTTIAVEESIRRKTPQPQFPHANYIEFADALAREIGVLPKKTSASEIANMFMKGPCIPAHYRLLGRDANPRVAMATVQEAWRKVGIS